MEPAVPWVEGLTLSDLWLVSEGVWCLLKRSSANRGLAFQTKTLEGICKDLLARSGLTGLWKMQQIAICHPREASFRSLPEEHLCLRRPGGKLWSATPTRVATKSAFRSLADAKTRLCRSYFDQRIPQLATLGECIIVKKGKKKQKAVKLDWAGDKVTSLLVACWEQILFCFGVLVCRGVVLVGEKISVSVGLPFGDHSWVKKCRHAQTLALDIFTWQVLSPYEWLGRGQDLSAPSTAAAVYLGICSPFPCQLHHCLMEMPVLTHPSDWHLITLPFWDPCLLAVLAVVCFCSQV